MAQLPTTGQTNWGAVLNAYLRVSLDDKGGINVTNTMADMATDFPSPEDGQTVIVKNENIIVRWDASLSNWDQIFGTLFGGGDVTGAANIGTAGVGLFAQKNGENLEFKTIDAASGKVTINNNTVDNEVEIDIDPSLINMSELNNDSNFVTAATLTWGTISGTLSAQTDLQNALDAKEDSVPVGTVSQYYRGDKTWQALDAVAVGLGNVTNEAAIPLSDKGATDGVATLVGGKIPTSQIPALAISETYVVADIAARDALTIQTGDVAIVSDAGTGQPKTYIYDGSAWQEVLTPAAPVQSVNGEVGVVSLATTNIPEGTNLYYTDARVSANSDVVANASARHNPVTIGTANGLSLTGQEVSLGLADGVNPGALSASDWTAFNSKQDSLGYTAEDIANKGVADGYASLDSSGKVPDSQLPNLAITDTFVVADEAAQLALTVEKGDVAVRTDENKTYINTTGNNTAMSDYQELLTPGGLVTSVNSQTGDVVLTKDDVGLTDVENVKSNLNALTAPVATNDLDEGYVAGSLWVDTANDKAYICVDNGNDAATWQEIGADVSSNVDVAANTAARHDALTLNVSATDAGLSLTAQELSYQAASGTQNGYLTSTDWTTFNNKQDALTILDEDDMLTDSETAVATQQSIKAYIDTAVGAVGSSAWGRDGTNGYIYPATLTDKVGVNTITPDEALEVFNGNIKVGDDTDAVRSIILERNSVDVGYINTTGSTLTMQAANNNGVNIFNNLATGLTVENDGTLNVVSVTDYETLVTADDDIPNKKYVDDLISDSIPLKPIVETADATQAELLVDGSTRMAIPADTTWKYTIDLAARQTGGTAGTIGDSAGFEFKGVIKRDGAGNTALVGSVTQIVAARDTGAAAWAVSIEADDTNESLAIKVTGEADKIIKWNAKVKITAVS